jgi:hypothetical protein
MLPTDTKIPLATGSTAAIFYILCVVLTSIDGLDDIMLDYFNITMHGVNVTEIWAPSINGGSFLIGLIATFITWFVIGWVFSILLKTFERR